MSLVWSKHLEWGPYFSNAKFLSGSKRRIYFKRDSLCIIFLCDACEMCLTRIILLIKTVRTPDYYILCPPREFLYVRTIIRQRYRTAVVLFLSGWYVRYFIEVLQQKKSSIQILHIPRILIRSMFIHRLFYIDIFLSSSPLSNFFLNILINHYISFTWYFLGSDCECFTKLHKATELRSSVHSVCNGSCFTLLQKGWIDFPLKHWNIFM